MDDKAFLAVLLAVDRDHSLQQNVQADLRAHPIYSLMDIAGAFPEKKSNCCVKLTTYSNLLPSMNQWSLHPLPPTFL